MFQRVLGNISNVANFNSQKEQNAPLKRTVNDDEGHQPLKKRTRPLNEGKQVAKNGPKKTTIAAKKRKNDVENLQCITNTIERKVKSIHIDDRKIVVKKLAAEDEHTTQAKLIEQEAISEPSLSPSQLEISQDEDCIIIEEESLVIDKEELAKNLEIASRFDQREYYVSPPDLPSNIEDHDREQLKYIESESFYAHDIFQYYRLKEREMLIKKYMHLQPEISSSMRAILVDWLVETQETLCLSHEILYTSVKILDSYCMKKAIRKSRFQLLGITAMFIAAKCDERILPPLNDFLYAHGEESELKAMEIDILSTLDFRLNFALSYRFLRRFAQCGKLSMEILTLARFILEMSLIEYDMIEELDSYMAAGALKLALLMKDKSCRENSELEDPLPKPLWTPTLEYYSGYNDAQLKPIVIRLNAMISRPAKNNLKNVRCKYSHSIFYEVAKYEPLPMDSFEETNQTENKTSQV